MITNGLAVGYGKVAVRSAADTSACADFADGDISLAPHACAVLHNKCTARNVKAV